MIEAIYIAIALGCQCSFLSMDNVGWSLQPSLANCMPEIRSYSNHKDFMAEESGEHGSLFGGVVFYRIDLEPLKFTRIQFKPIEKVTKRKVVQEVEDKETVGWKIEEVK